MKKNSHFVLLAIIVTLMGSVACLKSVPPTPSWENGTSPFITPSPTSTVPPLPQPTISRSFTMQPGWELTIVDGTHAIRVFYGENNTWDCINDSGTPCLVEYNSGYRFHWGPNSEDYGGTADRSGKLYLEPEWWIDFYSIRTP